MQGEWPVLLNILGKGEGPQRYLSVAEVKTLFVERRLPERIAARLQAEPAHAPAGGLLRKLAKAVLAILILLGVADRGDRRIPGPGGKPPAAACEGAAAAVAQPRPDQNSLLAGAELVAGGPPLVPSCQPGHRDFPRALCLVRRAGAAGPSPVHPARHAEGQPLSRTFRLHSESANDPYRRNHAAPLRLCQRVRDDAGPGLRSACGRRQSKMSMACRSALRG